MVISYYMRRKMYFVFWFHKIRKIIADLQFWIKVRTFSQEELDSRLRAAVKRGTEDETIKMLKSGANPNKTDHKGFAVLHDAVEFGHYKLIRTLLKYGADIEMQADLCGYRPLQVVVISPKPNECLDELMKYKVNLHSRDCIGSTILQAMVRHYPDNLSFIKKLVSIGLDPNTRDIIGNTCLHNLAAVRFVTPETTKLLAEFLIEKGANINRKNLTTFETPLHMACKNGKHYLMEVLLSAGANIDMRDKYENTPFDLIQQRFDGEKLKDLDRVFIKYIVLRLHRGEKINETLLRHIVSDPEKKKLFHDFCIDMNYLKREITPTHRVTYYDILHRSRIKVVKYLKNTEIRNAVLRCERSATIYDSDIKLRIEKASEVLRRKELVYAKVDEICAGKLPHLCVEKIASYLTIQDIELLVQSG